MINKVKDSHDILTLTIPTNEPKTFMNYFLKSLPMMRDVAPVSTIACNFQEPWTEDEVRDAVVSMEELGFKVCYQHVGKYHVESKGLVPFNRIRHDTAMLNKNSVFFALTDDDFEYRGPSASINKTAGHQYLDSLMYLTMFRNCGFVLMGGTMFKAVPRNHIGPVKLDEWFITGRGFIFRNMAPDFYVYPNDALDLKGAGEEKLIAAARMNEGFFPAKMGFARTRHDEIRNRPDVVPGHEMYGWLKEEIVEQNLNKYINDHYHTGIRGVYSYNVVLPDVYFSKGGVDHKKEFEMYDKDFTNSDPEKIVDFLIREYVEE